MHAHSTRKSTSYNKNKAKERGARKVFPWQVTDLTLLYPTVWTTHSISAHTHTHAFCNHLLMSHHTAAREERSLG